MEYQIYAYDKNGTLNHCGPEKIKEPVTLAKCKKLERNWRRWRRNYLRDNPGNYPLRKHGKKTACYVIHPCGDSSKTFQINFN